MSGAGRCYDRSSEVSANPCSSPNAGPLPGKSRTWTLPRSCAIRCSVNAGMSVVSSRATLPILCNRRESTKRPSRSGGVPGLFACISAAFPLHFRCISAAFPLHFRCVSAARSPAIPLPGGAGNLRPKSSKVNDLREDGRPEISCYFVISSAFPLQQRNCGSDAVLGQPSGRLSIWPQPALFAQYSQARQVSVE
jgi:hypothetical protein